MHHECDALNSEGSFNFELQIVSAPPVAKLCITFSPFFLTQFIEGNICEISLQLKVENSILPQEFPETKLGCACSSSTYLH